MGEEPLKKIEDKLDIIIRLLCNKCIEGKSKTDSILLLEALGVDREFIGDLTGSTPGSIKATVSTAKKKNQKEKPKKKLGEAQQDEQSQ